MHKGSCVGDLALTVMMLGGGVYQEVLKLRLSSEEKITLLGPQVRLLFWQ
jgi:hypothetical protein